MNDFNEYQSELFDEFSSDESKQRKLRRPSDYPRKINLAISREKLIFSGIFVILLFVISFSLGIERGKKIALRQIKNVSEGTNQPDSSVNYTPENQNETSNSPLADGKSATGNESDSQQVGIEIEPKKDIEEPTAKEEDLKEFYTLQAAAYSNLSRAQKEAKKVQDKGYKTTIDSSGKYHILLIGKYKTKAEADAIKTNFAKNYKGCYVRKHTIKEN
jgi:cell division septation protein DedD